MLKHSLAAGLLACAALTPVAFAQDNQASSGSKVQFIQTMDEQQFRGSELMGQTVYNTQDEAIGDIGDALIDKNGQVAAVIIDVGGFLGIGAREVGVPFNALRFEPATDRVASGSGSATSAAESGRAATSQGGPPPTAGSSATSNQDQSASSSAGSAGSTNTSSGSGQSAAQGSSGMSGQIDSARESSQQAASSGSMLDNMRIVLNTSREELQNAPELKSPNESGASSGSGASGTGSSAPAK